MKITYERWIVESNKLDKAMKEASKALKVFPKGEMGLTPDHIKATPEYKAAKLTYDQAFHMVRYINQVAPAAWLKRKARDRRAAMCKPI